MHNGLNGKFSPFFIAKQSGIAQNFQKMSFSK